MANAGATSSLLAHAAAATSTAPACPSTLFKSRKSTAAGPCHGSRRRRSMMTCWAAGGSGRGGGGDEGLLWLPRRDVLTGLTGVAAGLTAYPGLASAAVDAQLDEQCRRGDKVSDALVKCTDKGLPCPPTSTNPIVVDFTRQQEVKRTREPAHLLRMENREKYKEAVAKMKALPKENPLSFDAQSAIHEAYCDGHYRYDPTEKNRPFDVHFSWIFAPWHRMYIYFYERALGELIGDDTFALPYWNWDHPSGMALPAIFRDKDDRDPSDSKKKKSNPLYDPNRNGDHLNALVDLDFINTRSKPIPFDDTTNPAYQQAVQKNLCTIYQQQIRLAKGPRCFHGDKLCSETSFRMKEINERSKRRQDSSTKLKSSTSGTLERLAHSSVHVWTGRSCARDPRTCAAGHDGEPHCTNDMGFLGSASRDPVFYSHHANVDRMWHLWTTKLGGKDFEDTEWLDASFVFYDAGGGSNGIENPQLVRIKVSDVLKPANLGYAYDDDVDEAYKKDPAKYSKEKLPWRDIKPKRLVPAGAARNSTTPDEKKPKFPLPLGVDQVVVVPVELPAKVGDKLRVLEIQGIEFDPTKTTKFDVAINVPAESAPKVGPQHSEYAGSFVSVESSSDKKTGDTLEGKVSLVLDSVLADVGAQSAKSVNVVLVRRSPDEGQITINLPLRIQNEDFC